LKELEGKVGDGIWKFDTFHFGIHPNAKVTKDECPNDIYRRIIDHSHTSNMHWHLGSAPANERYNFYPHVTADIRNCTLRINDELVWDEGYMMTLQDPELQKIAAKYPDLPGIPERL
jgi:N-acetyl-gamma-glutamylphosphate reductase